jgi:hypothetical protein
MGPFVAWGARRGGMLARAQGLFLLAMTASAPLRAEPARAPAAAADPAGSESLASSKLRALLLDRLPGMPLRVPGSPRYLGLADPGARGTRVLVGWVLPGLSGSELPQLLSFAEGLSSALRDRPAASAVPFDAAVALDLQAEAPLLVIELSSRRAGVARPLEEALLDTLATLGLAAPPSGPRPPRRGAPSAPVPWRVSAAVRARLGPLARAVVEVHGPDAPSPELDDAKRAQPKRRVATGRKLARSR